MGRSVFTNASAGSSRHDSAPACGWGAPTRQVADSLEFVGVSVCSGGSERMKEMKAKANRVFVPVSKYIGDTAVETRVACWEWRRGFRLRCVYKDGTAGWSDYRGLRELFAGETVREVKP